MGIKLIVLLALLVGVLFGLHILIKDFRAITSGSKLLRLLFKRDVSSQSYTKPAVRWKRILQYDPIQCTRYFYCELGAHPVDDEIRRGFVYMLMTEPDEENRSAHAYFQAAYSHGLQFPKLCRQKYPMCIFKETFLFDLVKYLLNHPDI